jgi:hypothetical protein
VTTEPAGQWSPLPRTPGADDDTHTYSRPRPVPRDPDGDDDTDQAERRYEKWIGWD